MADCWGIILKRNHKNCKTINAAVGVDKDLILVNYDDFDKDGTTDDATNRVVTVDALNEGGL